MARLRSRKTGTVVNVPDSHAYVSDPEWESVEAPVEEPTSESAPAEPASADADAQSAEASEPEPAQKPTRSRKQ